MPEYKLEISGATIVLVGSFNPAIFHPEWFAKNELLPQREADNAELNVVHPQLSQFETERFSFQITAERFQAMAKPNTISASLRDLVLGTFYILEHTPVQAMGMNRVLHFAMGSEEAWHKLGDKLVPKEPWNSILEGRPGMRNLDVLTIRDSPKGSSLMVKVQPSVVIPHGVYFEINDHYAAQEYAGLKSMMEILRDQWDASQQKGESIARHIIDWAVS
jgi:hypothetical protein